MSWQRVALNLILRLTEKPYLARVRDPEVIRASFERRARWLFRPPRSVPVRQVRLGTGSRGLEALRVGDGADGGPVILYFHGGAYVFGSPRTHAGLAARLAQVTGLPVCLPDYRKAPEHPFPAAVEDARAAFEALVASGIPAGRIVLGGDSAGGGLALALLGDLCARGADLPAAAFAFSPLTDLGFSGESFRANAARDVMLPAGRDRDMAQMYLQGADPEQPLASPLMADFTGAGPVWLAAGDTEIMLDDTRRMAAHLRRQGVVVEEIIARDLPHVWPFFWRYLPEGAETLRALAGWISRQSWRSGES
uniref:Alpha/beta hydrolase fold-3 domain-containing protein n=1 Tax=uncultured organism TaxID=155900 RepID=A0A0G3FH42_9ZZZZ|nr:hypothetical protein [uncultured organism]